MNFWTEENAAQFVIAVMRVLMRYVVLKDDRSRIITNAHSQAEIAKTLNQAQYDLAFASSLRDGLLSVGIPKTELEDGALLDSLTIRTFAPEPVATEGPQAAPAPAKAAKPADPNDRSHWTVEDWQAAGISFRPAAVPVASSLPKLHKPTPEEMGPHHRTTPPDYLGHVEEPPWGARALVMTQWAWSAVWPHKLSKQRADEIAHLLSYLYFAGVLREGSILPHGHSHSRDVVGPINKGRKKK